MTETELRRAHAAALAKYGIRPLGEGEWTCQQFADSNDITYNQAVLVIKRMCSDGSARLVGDRLVGGHISHAYCYTNPLTPENPS